MRKLSVSVLVLLGVVLFTPPVPVESAAGGDPVDVLNIKRVETGDGFQKIAVEWDTTGSLTPLGFDVSLEIRFINGTVLTQTKSVDAASRAANLRFENNFIPMSGKASVKGRFSSILTGTLNVGSFTP